MPRRANSIQQHEVAKRITALRQARGMTKAAFARSCGFTPQEIGNYEVGGRLPSIPAAHKICLAHGVSFDYIYRGILQNLPDDLRERIPGLLARPKEPPRPPPGKR
jgi:DNA-binding XRE family transcriptional regulator